jgi:BlaI family penicillinase repressor
VPEPLELTELQIAILRILWKRGEATVLDVWEEIYRERGLAQTTIATILTRLEKRGVVSRTQQQRQFTYRAEVTEADVRESMLGGLTEQLFGGDVTALVNHLLTSRDIAPGDLQRLRAAIADAESGSEPASDRDGGNR